MMSGNVLALSKALGDDTRFLIYKYISEQTGPVSVEELAGNFGLHPNAIRLHLAKLGEAGLVTTESTRRGPGRPKKLYKTNRELSHLPFGKRDFNFLALLLLDFIVGQSIPPTEINSFGKKWGYSYIQGKVRGKPQNLEEIIQCLLTEFKEWGFEPEPVLVKHQRMEIRLKNCIFKELANNHPTLVCALVDGVAEGILSAYIDGFRIQIKPGLLCGENSCDISLSFEK